MADWLVALKKQHNTVRILEISFNVLSFSGRREKKISNDNDLVKIRY